MNTVSASQAGTISNHNANIRIHTNTHTHSRARIHTTRCQTCVCCCTRRGALGWLVPCEIQPMNTRSAGQSANVSINFLFTFVIGQAFLSMLCRECVG